MIYETNFAKLLKVIPDLGAMEPGDAKRLKSEGFMDLNVDMLDRADDTATVALRHSWICNGDSMADPDMEIRVDFAHKTAEALTFQQDGGGPVFQRVYSEDGKRFSPRLKKALNSFLRQWLMNLRRQGHREAQAA